MGPIETDTRCDEAEALFRAMADPWSTTVPRQLVHRRSVADVLLTAVVPVGDTSAVVAAQWARTHAFYQTGDGLHDPSLVLETLRQAGLALCHHQLGVDADRQFLLGDLRMRLVAPHLLQVGEEPARLVLRCELEDLKWRGSGLRGGRVVIRFFRDGRPLGQGSSTFTCVDPHAYGRLREKEKEAAPAATSHRPGCAPAVPPELVGRLRGADVLLCECTGGASSSWGLRADPAHPYLFDHPNDHVPGMAVLEACRQSALLAASSDRPAPRFDAWSIAFAGLVPLDGLSIVEVAEDAGGAAVAVVRRGGSVLARATFETTGRDAATGRPFAASVN